MVCPQCNSEKVIKNGNVKQQQRYLCKSCNFQFLPHKNKQKTDPKITFKRRALHLMLEGLSIRKIADILSIAPTTIANWKKQWNHPKFTALIKTTPPEYLDYNGSLNYITSRKNTLDYTILWMDLATDISFINHI